MAIEVPYLTDERLAETAEDFLARHHSAKYLPIPIEEIIDFDFSIDIIPMPGLKDNFDVDAFLSSDLTEIRVDQQVHSAKNKNRYRFSLAHELSHVLLHSSAFAQLSFRTIQEYKSSRETMPKAIHNRMEFQAYALAGLILVPPYDLEERFKVAESHAKKCGIYLDNASPEAWEMIAGFLSGEFYVSRAVIEKRAIKDGLWEGESM